MKALIKEGAETHNKLLEYRYSVKKTLTNQGIEDQKKLLALQNGTPVIFKSKKVEIQSNQQPRRQIQELEIQTGLVSAAGTVSGTGTLGLIDGNQQVRIYYFHFPIIHFNLVEFIVNSTFIYSSLLYFNLLNFISIRYPHKI